MHQGLTKSKEQPFSSRRLLVLLAEARRSNGGSRGIAAAPESHLPLQGCQGNSPYILSLKEQNHATSPLSFYCTPLYTALQGQLRASSSSQWL